MTGITELENTNPADIPLAQDLVFGAAAIAKATGLTRRRVYHLTEQGHMPTFRLGATLCARRSTLRRWFEEMESVAMLPSSSDLD